MLRMLVMQVKSFPKNKNREFEDFIEVVACSWQAAVEIVASFNEGGEWKTCTYILFK